MAQDEEQDREAREQDTRNDPDCDDLWAELWADAVARALEPEPEELNPFLPFEAAVELEAETKRSRVLERWLLLTIGVLELPEAKLPRRELERWLWHKVDLGSCSQRRVIVEY